MIGERVISRNGQNNMKPISVSQLNNYLGRIIQTDPVLGNISVKGEISNLNYHPTGHIYFNLKDSKSNLRCFMAKTNAACLRWQLEDGMEVTASGFVSVFERGGYYSLNVKIVEVEGAGNLDAAFRALRDKLSKEGIFDEAHKKSLPPFPKNIAVVTSPTGAAVRDIIKIITGRNDYVNVTVYPCLVQGESAAADIASVIDMINRKFSESTDMIIVGRGGGSAEDLWSFNEEIVARSIYNSTIPVISAVGHETDFTIADFVADVRAETPTAAANIAVPDTFAIREALKSLCSEMTKSMKNLLTYRQNRLSQYSHDRLSFFINSRLANARMKLSMQMIAMRAQIHTLLEDTDHTIEKQKLVIELSDPGNIIKKGYAAITDSEGKFLRSVSEADIKSSVRVYVNDGNLICEVTGKDDRQLIKK